MPILEVILSVAIGYFIARFELDTGLFILFTELPSTEHQLLLVGIFLLLLVIFGFIVYPLAKIASLERSWHPSHQRTSAREHLSRRGSF